MAMSPNRPSILSALAQTGQREPSWIGLLPLSLAIGVAEKMTFSERC